MSFRSSLAATTLLATLAGPALAGTPYVLDPAHLSTLFVVDHMGYSKIYGRFGQVAGTVDFDPQAVETSSLSVTIKAASVDTNFGPRDDHLRSPDFFNVREFPDITFVSKKIEKTGERTGKVTGALTLLGVTRPVVLDVTFNKDAESPVSKKPTIGFSAHGTIKRSEFGMKYGVPALGDEIDLRIEAEAARS